jgi:SAM-dependent methyltransferase
MKFTYECGYVIDPTMKLGKIKRIFLEFMPMSRYKKKYMVLHFSERIVENPFVIQNIPEDKNIKILEVGCTGSKIAVYLTNLGYKVDGVDLVEYDYEHPNFTFYKGNFFDLKFESDTYDVIILLSVIEHVGLDVYGNKIIDERGDIEMLREVHRILKPGGKVILTAPYGNFEGTPIYRVYDEKRVNELFGLFESKKYIYYERKNNLYYMECRKKELENKKFVIKGGIKGLICAIAWKKN